MLRWATENASDPATAAADWLARDIDPNIRSAADMVSSPFIPLSTLKRAKNVFKTLLVAGETAEDRLLGANLYVMSIAAALVFHDVRISRQSSRALRRALRRVLEDTTVPEMVHETAYRAISLLDQQGERDDPIAYDVDD
ncbi:MAG: hypothetical protein KDA25_09220 [Phycisphaerales bacterium]|nr:hypothetical protein [Phycisphaerales bacterium]